MSYSNINQIPKEKFTFTQVDTHLHDELDVSIKPIGYFKDAWMRFRKNRASVVASIIIIAIILFAIVTPFVSDYRVSDINGVYIKMRPKLEVFDGSGFWDGGMVLRLNEKYLMYLTAIGIGAEDGDGRGVTWEEGITSDYYPVIDIGETYMMGGSTYRDCRIDSYHAVGFRYVSMTRANYEKLIAWQEETGIQAVYPMVDTLGEWCDRNNADDANFWYRHAANSAPVDANGSRMSSVEEVMEKGLVDNYLRDENGVIQYYAVKDMSMLSVRVLYYNYYQYLEGREPLHILGTDAQGFDILVRLASGIRLSLIFATWVSLLNLLIGTFYGAIEGYYGGTIDLVMERISDILGYFPFMVTVILFQMHLVLPGRVSPFLGLLFAFVFNGWLGIAYNVRTQFYRYKNQEYILAARTLGAKDSRIMFRHIFPNAIGTIITSSVLIIPATIASESVVSFLNLASFNSRDSISLGTMLSNAQSYLATDPHILLFPAAILSLMMISFNLFGNGLRDAFNPSLRGTEE